MEMQAGKDIAKIPQHDLEFLLALYFQFHLENKDHMALKCEKEGCQMDEIERHIKIKSALLHKFKVMS